MLIFGGNGLFMMVSRNCLLVVYWNLLDEIDDIFMGNWIYLNFLMI